MPQVEWYLKPQGHNTSHDPDYIKILIDPALTSGDRRALGASLFLPYAFVIPGQSRLISLLSLEGGISWGSGSNANNDAQLPIPSQIVWPLPQYRLQVPINDAQIEAIEHERNGSVVNLRIQLRGLACGSAPLGSVVPIQNALVQSFSIERERWLTILQRLKDGVQRASK